MDMWGVFLSVINLLLWCLMTSKRNAVEIPQQFFIARGSPKSSTKNHWRSRKKCCVRSTIRWRWLEPGKPVGEIERTTAKAPQRFWPFSWQQKHQTYLPNSSSKISEFELVHASCDDKPIIILPIEGNDKKLSICGKSLVIGDGFQPIKFTSYLFTIVGSIPNTHKCK